MPKKAINKNLNAKNNATCQMEIFNARPNKKKARSGLKSANLATLQQSSRVSFDFANVTMLNE